MVNENTRVILDFYKIYLHVIRLFLLYVQQIDGQALELISFNTSLCWRYCYVQDFSGVYLILLSLLWVFNSEYNWHKDFHLPLDWRRKYKIKWYQLSEYYILLIFHNNSLAKSLSLDFRTLVLWGLKMLNLRTFRCDIRKICLMH